MGGKGFFTTHNCTKIARIDPGCYAVDLSNILYAKIIGHKGEKTHRYVSPNEITAENEHMVHPNCYDHKSVSHASDFSHLCLRWETSRVEDGVH